MLRKFMNSRENKFDWRIIYAVFCLIYTGCLVYLGLGNFHKVYGEYRQASYRLQPLQIKQIAFEELAAECRAKLKRRAPKPEYLSSAKDENNCQQFSAATLNEYQKVVGQRLQIEKKRIQRKLIVFYLSFALFFVFLPLYLLYLFLKFMIWLFKGVKISK